MEKTIENFVGALRRADVPVSPAETLDAMAALEIVGFNDKTLFQNTLSIIFAKTPEEKAQFDLCFDRFFSFDKLAQDSQELKRIQSEFLELSAQGLALEPADKRQRKRSARNRRASAYYDSRLGNILLSGNANDLALALLQAAEEISLNRIKSLRERGIYTRRILLHLGINQLDSEIDRLSRETDDKPRKTALLLSEARGYLVEQVKAYVDEQYLLLVDASGNRFLTDALLETKLSNAQVYYFEHLKETVRKLAHQLAKRHAKRKKVANRGQLDFRKTIRKNVAYDGSLFELQWKQVKHERPAIFVLCDVSGSVRNVSRFLLTFLYSLNEVLPRVRSFVFSNELGEVTEYFEQYGLDEAVDMSLDDYGKGSTDYGSAFRIFADMCLKDVDSRSTVIILGDGRNNYFANGADTLKKISKKCRQLIWLNPEQRDRWRTGDAEMAAYLPACHAADVCNSLSDLQKIASRVLRSVK